jgi:hypothetical protein
LQPSSSKIYIKQPQLISGATIGKLLKGQQNNFEERMVVRKGATSVVNKQKNNPRVKQQQRRHV